MTASQMPLEHPLLAAVRAMNEVLDETAHLDPLFMSAREKGELLAGLTRVLGRLQARRAGVLAVADDVAAEQGARSAAAWLAGETRTELREAIRAERLGDALADRWSRTADAALGGTVSWDQVVVLVRSLDALPDDLDAELVAKAEAHLLAEAGQFGPRELGRLGRRVLEVVAPDVADVEEARALAAEERRARRVTRLSFRPQGDGSTDLYARLPDHVASCLRAYLDAFTSPRGSHLGDVDRLPLHRRRGEAFCALLAWPVLRASFRSCSAAPARSSTRAGPDGCSRPVNARPWRSATAGAVPRAARSQQPGARPLTPRPPGRTGAAQTSTTASYTAPSTTIAPMTPGGTRHASPRETSATPGGREGDRRRWASRTPTQLSYVAPSCDIASPRSWSPYRRGNRGCICAWPDGAVQPVGEGSS